MICRWDEGGLKNGLNSFVVTASAGMMIDANVGWNVEE